MKKKIQPHFISKNNRKSQNWYQNIKIFSKKGKYSFKNLLAETAENRTTTFFRHRIKDPRPPAPPP